MYPIVEKLKGGLIVSCQAHDGEPLHGPVLMAAMAYSAELGGASGIRANGVDDIALIRRTVRLPIIGILKERDQLGRVWITPTVDAAEAIVAAGSDIVATHATREKPFGDRVEEIIDACHNRLNVPVMADCATLSDAIAAAEAGADIVATTLSDSKNGPDFGLLERIVQSVTCPVIAEGGYWYPEQVVKALDCGAYAVVVGTAITRPREITRRYVEFIQRRQCKGLK